MAREKVRLPLEDMERLAFDFGRRLPDDLEWHFGGSLRRRAETVGDIDVVFVLPEGRDLTSVELPTPVELQASGPSIVRGEYDLGGPDLTHVDVWCCTPQQRGAFMWFITGPKSLNVAMRSAAQRQGMTLSQYGLFDAAGVQVDRGTEYSVALHLEMNLGTWVKLLDPESRESWNAPPSSRQREFEVTGSGGQVYLVKVSRSGATCTCKGFRYRSRCRHVDEAVS